MRLTWRGRICLLVVVLICIVHIAENKPAKKVKRKSDDKKSDHTTISRKLMRHALRKLKNQKAKHEDASTKAALGGPAADEEAGKTPVVNVAQNPTALAAAGNLNRVLSESIGKLSSASQQMNSALNGGNGGPMGDARPPVVQSQGPPLHCPSPCSQACAPQGCNPSCCMSQVPMQMPMQMPQMMPMPMPQMMPQMMPQPMPYQMPMYSAPCQPPACQSYYPPPPPPPPPLQITVSKPRIFALPPPPPPAMLCPGMCQQQCAPSCPHSCCGPAPPAQLMANQCPPICAQQCAPQCAHACCGPSQQMMPQPMQMPMPMPQPMPMQMPMPMAGGCSPACQPQSCQPGCPPMCCGAGRR